MPPLDHILMGATVLFAGLAAREDLAPMLPYLLGKTSYAQAVHGRIPNRLLFVWLLFGFAVIALAYAWTSAGGVYLAPGWIETPPPDGPGMDFHAALFLNAGLAFGLGVTLWLLGLWAAGDAKMYALIGFTLPLSTYQNNYLDYFPSFALFINTFIAMFFMLLLEFLAKTLLFARSAGSASLGEKIKELLKKGWEQRYLVLKLVLFFLALFTLIRIMRHGLREGLGQFMEINKTIIYVILFMVFRPLMRLAQHTWAMVLGALILGGYAVYAFFFDPTGQAKWEFINIGWLAVSIILFRVAYDAYLKATDEVPIAAGALRRGMILADSEITKFKERRQFYTQKVGTIAPDGLSEEQAEAIRGWLEENEAESVAVARTIPFAPSLLLGTLLTIIFKGLIFVF